EIALLQAESNEQMNLQARFFVEDNLGTVGALMKRRSELMIQKFELESESTEVFLPLQRLERQIVAIDEQIESMFGDYKTVEAAKLQISGLKLASLEERLV